MPKRPFVFMPTKFTHSGLSETPHWSEESTQWSKFEKGFNHAIWIDNNQDFAECCQQWLTEYGVIGIDTEFQRTDTYYPIPALLQFYTGQDIYIVDPLSISDFMPLSNILMSQNVVKVLHSFYEDIEVLYRLCGVDFSSVFDNQIAAAFCGFGNSIGYQKLVKAIIGVELDKEQCRSDWLKRPLTKEQIHYAAQDVLGLLPIYRRLQQQLESTQRLQWVKEECHFKIDKIVQTKDPELAYLDVKQAWLLNSKELSIVKTLAAWRERTAQLENKPKNTLLNDQQLMKFARFKPKHKSQLFRWQDMRISHIKRWGDDWMALIQAAQSTKSEWPECLPRPLNPHAGQWLKLAGDKIHLIARELDLPPELLMRKKVLENLIRSGYPNGGFAYENCLDGWRKDVLLEPLQKLLEQLPRIMPPSRSFRKHI